MFSTEGLGIIDRETQTVFEKEGGQLNQSSPNFLDADVPFGRESRIFLDALIGGNHPLKQMQ